MDDENYYQPVSQGRRLPKKRLILFSGAAVLVLVILIAIINSFTSPGPKGNLEVVTSSDNASVSVQAAGEEAETIGQGSTVHADLPVGRYQVTATEDERAASAVAEITEGQKTRIELTIEDLVPAQQVAPYSARDIHPSGNDLYFVDANKSVLNVLPSGNVAARPYLTGLGQVNQAYWLSPTDFYSKTPFNVWSHVSNGSAVPFGPPNQPLVGESGSFNEKGAAAFITEAKTIVTTAGPGQPWQTLGETSTANTRTSIAPDGAIVTYTPILGEHNYEEPTKIFRGGAAEDLPEELIAINSAQWSPDSTKFSFASEDGIFIFNPTDKTTTPILALEPTNPEAVVWLTPTTVLYARGESLWKYQIDTGVSVKLASLEGAVLAFQPFSRLPDSQTIFVSTQQNDAIYKIAADYNELPTSQQQAVTEQLDDTQGTPSYDGFETFLDRGVSADQVEMLKYAMGQYAASENITLTRATIATNSLELTPHDRNSSDPTDIIDFKLSLNDQNLRARFEYAGLSKARLYLFNDQTGAQVYDSGELSAR